MGKRYDPETGFINFGRRYYSPDLMRWITPDPIGYTDGPNLYAYVHNSPMIYFDEYGLLYLETSRSAAEKRAFHEAEKAGFWDAMPFCSSNEAFQCDSFEMKAHYYMGMAANVIVTGGVLKVVGAAWRGLSYLMNMRRAEIGINAVSHTKQFQATSNALSRTENSREVVTQAGKINNNIGENILRKNRPSFIGTETGTVVPTNSRQLIRGLREAGIKSFVPDSPGIGFRFKNGLEIRIMEPTWCAPLRASYGTQFGGRVSIHTGKIIQPVKNECARAYAVRWRLESHVELY